MRAIFSLLLVSLVSIMAGGLVAQSPTEPTTLFVDSDDAQAGTQGNPVNGINTKPYFSAIFNHDTPTAIAAEAKLQFASDAAFTNVVGTSAWKAVAATAVGARIPDVQYTGSALDCVSLFYWRIRIKDDLGVIGPWSTETASFNTVACPHDATNLFVGNDEAQTGTQGDPVTGINTKPTFSAVMIHDSATALSAEAKVQFATDAAFTNIVGTSAWKPVAMVTTGNRISDVEYNGSALACDTQYYWRIKIKDDAGIIGPWSTETASFITVHCPEEATTLFIGNSEAQTGTQGDPVSLINIQPYCSAIITHSNPSEQVVEAKVQFALDAAFDNKLGTSSWKSITPTTAGNRCSDVRYNGQAVPGNTRVYWRIRFKDAAGVVGNWSTEAASFETVPSPIEPTILFVDSTDASVGTQGDPVTGIDLDPVFSAIFNHNEVTGVSSRARVQVASDSAFNTEVWNSGWQSIAATADGARVPDIVMPGGLLVDSTTYYWRIRIEDTGGNKGPWSIETASFTTGSGTPPTPLTVTLDGGFESIPQGMTLDGTVTKTGGASFNSGNTLTTSAAGLSATLLSVTSADEIRVQFTATQAAAAGTQTLTVLDSSTAIAEGPVLVSYPHQRVATRLPQLSQEPRLNPAVGGYSTMLASGEFTFDLPLISLPGRMLNTDVSLSYRSGLDFNGPTGRGWTASYMNRLLYSPLSDEITLYGSDGRIDVFSLAAGGTATVGPYVNAAFYAEITRSDATTPSDLTDDTFSMVMANGDVSTFANRYTDTANQLVYAETSFADRYGNTVAHVYDAEGRVIEIRGDLYDALTPNRYRLVLSYGSDQRVSTITDYADFSTDTDVADLYGTYTGAREWAFVYDSLGRLSEVRLPRTKDWFNDVAGSDGRARILFRYASDTGPSQALLSEVYSPEQANSELESDSGLAWLKNGFDASLRVATQDVGRTSESDTGHRYHIVYGTGVTDVVDPVGVRTTYTLSGQGRVSALRQHTGFFDGTLTQTGSKLRGSDPDFFDESFEYNTAGELTRHIKPRGNEVVWFYDLANSSYRARGNLLRMATLPGSASTTGLPPGQVNGILWTFTYEPAFNQLATTVDPRAYDVQAGYDITQPGQLARDDSALYMTQNIFDASNNLVETRGPAITAAQSPNSPTTGQQYRMSYGYNTFGQLVSETDISDYGTTGQVGYDVSYVYGTAGNELGLLVEQVAAPLSTPFKTQYDYDSVGREREMRDNVGSGWNSHFDQLDRLVRTRSPGITILGGLSYEVRRGYDREGNEILVEADDTLFDVNGNLTTQVDVVRTQRTYGPLGHVVTKTEDVTSTTSRTTTLVYDARYRVTEGQSSSGVKSATRFDERGLILLTANGILNAESDPNNALVKQTYSYDANGNTNSTVDPRNFTRVNTFDAYDRLLTASDARPTPTVVGYTYDHSGNVVAMESVGAFGDCSVPSALTRVLERHEYFFDNAGREYRRGRIALDDDGTTPLAYSGRFTTVTDDRPGWDMTTDYLLPDGRLHLRWNDQLDDPDYENATPRLYIEYDSLLRTVVQGDPVGNETVTVYNAAGHISTVTESRFSQYTDTLSTILRTHTRDELGRTISTWVTKGGNPSPATDIRHDAFDRPVFENLQGKQKRLRRYDLAGRVVSMTNTMSGVWTLSSGDIATNGTSTGTATFTYDDDDNLVGWTEADAARVHQIFYDIAGRQVQTIMPSGKKHTVGSTDSVTPLPGTVGYVAATDGHDAAGNVLKVNDLGGNVVTRTYNSEDEISSVTVVPFVSAEVGGERSATFICDGLGRMLTSSSTDDAANVLTRAHTWTTLGTTSSQLTATNSVTDTSVDMIHDPMGRKQDYENLANGNKVEIDFDGIDRESVVRQKNQFGFYNASYARTYFGRTSKIDGASNSASHHFRASRGPGGRRMYGAILPVSSGTPQKEVRYEYGSCDALLAIINDTVNVLGSTDVYGTRMLQDGAGRQVAKVTRAVYPEYASSDRANDWDMNLSSTAEVSIFNVNGEESQRAIFRGEKKNLQGTDGVVDIARNLDGVITSVGDIAYEHKESTYPNMTHDGVFDYHYDYQGRLLKRTRVSDGKDLNLISYDALGATRKHEFIDMPVVEVDFSTSMTTRSIYSTDEIDLNGGGIKFTTTEENYIETYFPGNLRPLWSGDVFQGAQRSYHDFLVSEAADATISFIDPRDLYEIQFRIVGTNVGVYTVDTNFNQTSQQWETTETQLTTATLTTPTSGRRLALGIRLDIAATGQDNHNVVIDLWSNGSQRLTGQTFQAIGFNYAPEFVQFRTKSAGARLYRYNSYVEAQSPTPTPRPIIANEPTNKANHGLMALTDPPQGNWQSILIQTGEQMNALDEGLAEFRSALTGMDFGGVSGYADLISRSYSDGLRGGSQACKEGLLFHIDKIENKIEELRMLLNRASALERQQARLNQVNPWLSNLQTISISGVRIEGSGSSAALWYDVPDFWNIGNGGPVLITTGICAENSEFVGAFFGSTLDTEALQVDVSPRGFYGFPCGWVDQVFFVTKDGCGNHYLITLPNCFDAVAFVQPFSVTHLLPHELSFIFQLGRSRMEAMYRALEQDDAERRAQLSDVSDEIEKLRSDFVTGNQSLLRQVGVLEGYWNECGSIFETEGWYSFADTFLSEMLASLVVAWVPGLGTLARIDEGFDIARAGWAAAEGDYTGAALNLVLYGAGRPLSKLKLPRFNLGRFNPSSKPNVPTKRVGELTGIDNRLHPDEIDTGLRLSEQLGRPLRQSEHIGAEFVDDLGNTYDALGRPGASRYWNEKQFFASIDGHLLKSNDFTAIDLTGFTGPQKAAVRNYLDSLPAASQARIIRIGF